MEMQQISKAFGEESSTDEIEEVVEMMDTDCDGKVSFDEFKSFMKKERYKIILFLQINLSQCQKHSNPISNLCPKLSSAQFLF
jgi:hypothetical protein